MRRSGAIKFLYADRFAVFLSAFGQQHTNYRFWPATRGYEGRNFVARRPLFLCSPIEVFGSLLQRPPQGIAAHYMVRRRGSKRWARGLWHHRLAPPNLEVG